jgi:multiple antibiotic resistance protein
VRLITGARETVSVRAKGEQVAASIAMPFIVGPGTISASVIAGARLDWGWAALAIALAQLTALVALLLFKRIHDHVRANREPLMQRYTEIVGRATALFAGSFAIDMILRGVEDWLEFVAAQP